MLGGALKEAWLDPLAAAVPAAERLNFSDQVITLESTHQSMLAREEAQAAAGGDLCGRA